MFITSSANVITSSVNHTCNTRKNDPPTTWLPSRKFEFWVCYQLFINVFIGRSAEPKLFTLTHNEAKGTNMRLIPFTGC